MSSRHSNSFPPALSTSLALTLGAFSCLAVPSLVVAQTATKAAAELDAIEVRSTRETPAYQPAAVQSPKLTQPLRDTPQSISVVPAELIREQNAQSLQEVLQNVPGITFTSGEGNLGWGDFFTIRGFSAEQAITIDGVRDAGMASRTDTFNLEQAEVYKGTGSVESGVSAVGGSVNLVSKEAGRDTFYNSSAGVGSDGYRRVTADLNRSVGETGAVRLNLMKHHNDVAGRDVVDYDRYGVAASFAHGLGTSTRTVVNMFHQVDDNMPDGGLPIQRGTGGRAMPGVPRHAWYGASNLYTQQSRTDTVTARIEHDLSPDTTVRNQFRYERADNWSVLAPARLNSGSSKNSLGYVGLGPLIAGPGGVLSYGDYGLVDTTGASASLRLASVPVSKRYTIADNQTDVRTRFETAGFKHDLTAGLELYRETYGDRERSMDLPTGTLGFDMANPSTVFPGTPTVVGAGSARASVQNAGVYVNDTITFSPQWQAQTALRYDRWQAGNGSASRTDGALSGRLGLVYKPASEGSIYVSYSRAAQPSAVGVTTNNGVYGTAAQLAYAPALSRTWEAGSKWDVLGGRLSLTGAVFRTELSDSWEYNADNASPIRALPSKRVQGFELGAQGEITPRWSVSAGLSHLKSRITKGANEGAEARNVPDWSGSVWTSFLVTPAVTLSWGAQYVGERRYADNVMVGGQNNTSSTAPGANGAHPIYVADHEKAPSYLVQNLALSWRINRQLTARFNINNLTNRFYWSRIGASLDGFQLYGVPGAGRTYTAGLDMSF
ncbi:TonB-dependent siderophore receptor [Delftia sp. UME58]|uniref:TonB-dependent receptor n=1 Tax=Delftia sp. UME58 TaxID=1862322 RepID=UPI001603AC4B|nr:TonB-dependent siderophore receptor [Delftia sp. UME58]MBB1652760.1 TonB-dependent receptor [Delftia sp. UME58]